MAIVTLKKAIVTHKGTVNSIALNEPTARCFIRYGEPFKVNVTPDGGIQFDYSAGNKAMLGFLAEMSGIDEIVLEDLAAKDFLMLRTEATNLILGAMGSNPTEPPVV